jgi:death on curing protein
VTELLWIDEQDALVLHDRLIALHGGAPGVRDPGLLQSALARPQQLAAYEPSSDVIQLAARYTAAILRNHPFVDGNKRTGFVIGILFLELNGYEFKAREEDAAQAIIALAAGTVDEADYAAFLAASIASPTEAGRSPQSETPPGGTSGV